MGASRASKNLLMRKTKPLKYKRIPWERVKYKKEERNRYGQAAEMDETLRKNRAKGIYPSGIGVGP